ncbi:MAG: DUF975 family protein [Agathobacter sp.]|nr:DUF975 family protein [Agathobacter sp.]
MWTRKEIKEKAKISLKQNYWKAVLVGILLTMLGTGGGTSFNYNIQDEDIEQLTQEIDSLAESNDNAAFEDAAGMQYSEQYWYEDNSEEYWKGYYDGYFGLSPEGASIDYMDGYNDGILDDYVEAGYDPYAEPEAEDAIAPELGMRMLGVILLMCLVIIIVALIIGLMVAAFIGNPLDLGAKKFMLTNLNEKAEIKELAYAFDSNYKNIAKILFFRDLYLILWSFLFIIPGIVKSYEYFMVPYLLIENPSLSKQEVFAMSKQMMKGQKWRVFVLHLSFFGWDLLSVFTLGALNTFYVTPYRNLTFAAVFEELNAANGYPARPVQNSFGQAYYQDTTQETYDNL